MVITPAQVAAGIAVFGLLYALYPLLFVHGVAHMGVMLGLAIAGFAGTVAIVLGGIGVFFGSSRRRGLVCIAAGAFAPLATLAAILLFL